MALPNVTINLENGNLGRIAQSDDGVAGLILTGAAVSDKLALNEVYLINSSRDIARLGITAENNPLAHKELTAFYTETGDGAELYLLVVSEATLLSQMCSIEEGSPLKKLITYAKGRIRLVGINRLPPDEYSADTTDTGIDKDAVTAATAAQSVGESFARKVMPFRCLIPAAGWDGKTDKLYKPREGSTNRVGFVMACDDRTNKTAAIGQMLGRAARISVNQSLARVKSGAITAEGWLTNGRTPEECDAMLDLLDEAGYIIYRSFSKKNGYYPNDDHMGAPLSDDYSNLNYGRVAAKATIYAYTAYIEEIQDDIETDDEGNIPQEMCSYYERLIDNAVAVAMQGEISDFKSYVDPAQNVLSTRRMAVSCRIRPRGTLRYIIVNLGFENPAIKQ